ncbi:hypothetical protein OEZ86_013604 [Tetradesmus obliquus]|nr:hypothetical protein OEZ86_013604 [Tetradesmus obliquus]
METARHNVSSRATFTKYELDNPFDERQFRYVAKGVYTNGPRCNQPCVCKWFKTGAVYEDTYFEKDLKAVDKAQEIIDAWNALNISNTIHLNRPEVWVFDRDSRRPGQKTLTEPFINNYTKFNSNSGWACSTDGWCEVMQALSHFSYHRSGGQLVLCDLQGGMLSRGRGAVLTDPVIMSRSRSYGVTDLGPDGISTFFARHSCSRYCQAHWTQPRNTAVHYQLSSCTTMEMGTERHLNGGGGQRCCYGDAIYEDDEEDHYNSDTSDGRSW